MRSPRRVGLIRRSKTGHFLLTGVLVTSALSIAAPVCADISELTEVVVTARKRQESILSVPVVESVIPQAQMERMGVAADLQDVAKLVPGLSFGESLLSIGTQVSLRGVGTSTLDPGVDQSVSLNIDGLQLASGLAFGAGCSM